MIMSLVAETVYLCKVITTSKHVSGRFQVYGVVGLIYMHKG